MGSPSIGRQRELDRRIWESPGFMFYWRLRGHLAGIHDLKRACESARKNRAVLSRRDRWMRLKSEIFARSMPVEFYAEYRAKIKRRKHLPLNLDASPKNMRLYREWLRRFYDWFEDRAGAYNAPLVWETERLMREARELRSAAAV